jgi:hypothetical protein
MSQDISADNLKVAAFQFRTVSYRFDPEMEACSF